MEDSPFEINGSTKGFAKLLLKIFYLTSQQGEEMTYETLLLVSCNHSRVTDTYLFFHNYLRTLDINDVQISMPTN